MTMTLTLAPILFVLLSLAADPVSSAPAVTPAASPSASPAARIAARPPRAIVVTSVEPTQTYSGDLVTIKGTGLDQGSVLLLGPVSPVLLEVTEKKIVFRAPETDHNRPDVLEALLYLVTPGFALTNTEVTMRISPPWLRGRSAPPPPAAPSTPTDQKFETSAGKPFRDEIDFDGARLIEVVLTCTGADVEMVAERTDRSGVSQTRATRGGSLTSTFKASDFSTKGEKSDLPGRIKATFATDSTKLVPCRIRITRRSLPPS